MTLRNLSTTEKLAFRGPVELAITLRVDQSFQKLNVLFLVTIERLNETILVFNSIKMFVRLNDKLDLLYEMVCQSEDNELSQDNIRAFVKST